MNNTIKVAGILLVAGLGLSAAPVSAASFGPADVSGPAPLVESVQYGYGYRGDGYGRRRGVTPGRVVRRILGVGPGYRGRGYRRGYDRGYGRGYGGGRGYYGGGRY